jgi:hypothetical protein
VAPIPDSPRAPRHIRGEGDAPEVVLWSTSLYGAKNRRGLVELSKQDQDGSNRIAQMTPAEARSVAMDLLEAAEAAEMDTIVMDWLQRRIQTPFEQAVQVLGDFRRLRDELKDDDQRDR